MAFIPSLIRWMQSCKPRVLQMSQSLSRIWDCLTIMASSCPIWRLHCILFMTFCKRIDLGSGRRRAGQRFLNNKKLLQDSPLLVHYDLKKSLRLACDVSSCGIGAVISHVMENGEEKPIASASRTLTASEHNYSQVEKEALSIVFWVKKFHSYLYGRRFTLLTDHRR